MLWYLKYAYSPDFNGILKNTLAKIYSIQLFFLGDCNRRGFPFPRPGLGAFGGGNRGGRGPFQGRGQGSRNENRGRVCKERCQANGTCPTFSNTDSAQTQETCLSCIRSQNCGESSKLSRVYI